MSQQTAVRDPHLDRSRRNIEFSFEEKNRWKDKRTEIRQSSDWLVLE